jgi:hypothetical protein
VTHERTLQLIDLIEEEANAGGMNDETEDNVRVALDELRSLLKPDVSDHEQGASLMFSLPVRPDHPVAGEFASSERALWDQLSILAERLHMLDRLEGQGFASGVIARLRAKQLRAALALLVHVDCTPQDGYISEER